MPQPGGLPRRRLTPSDVGHSCSPARRIRLRRRALRKSAGFIREHDLHPAIALPPGFCLVGGDRIRLAKTFGLILIGRHAARAECLGHSLRTSLRQLLVVSFAAAAIRVTFDDDAHSGLVLQELRKPVESAVGAGLQGCPTRVEEYITQGHHHAALGLLGLQIL